MPSLNLRAATAADAAAVAHFLRYAPWITLEISLVEVEKHLGEWPGWLLLSGERVRAFLQLDPRRFPVVQLHMVACADRMTAQQEMPQLLAAAARYGQEVGSLPLLYVGDTPWLARALRAAGYQRINRVVFFEKRGAEVPAEGNRAVVLLPAVPEQVEALVALDAAAFDPIWRNNASFFEEAFSLFPLFAVAFLQEKLVGYLIGDLQRESGFLVRVAVHPHWQQQGIGTRLLAEAVAYFREHRRDRILLNTQQDNLRAQRLYRAFGFHATGEALDVWQEERERETSSS